MIPDGADAMVMVEYSELFDASSVAIYGAVPPGRNVVQIGEDVQEGDVILPAGTRIRASRSERCPVMASLPLLCGNPCGSPFCPPAMN